MLKTFASRLDILDDLLVEAAEAPDVCADAKQAIKQLDSCKRALETAKNNIARTVARINSGLAMAIRLRKPGLAIALDGSCRIGYFSRSLTFTPNLYTNQWEVTSTTPQLVKRFLAKKPPLRLSSDFEPLSASVVTVFADHYRSLGEEIIGTGKILVEGRPVTLCQLAESYRRGAEDA